MIQKIFVLGHSGFHHWKEKYQRYLDKEFYLRAHPDPEIAQLPQVKNGKPHFSPTFQNSN